MHEPRSPCVIIYLFITAQDVARATASLAAAATAGALSAVLDADRGGSGRPMGDATSTSPSPLGSSSPTSSSSTLAAMAGGSGRAEALLVLAVSAACRASTREYLDAMGYVRAPRAESNPLLLVPTPADACRRGGGSDAPAAAHGTPAALGSPDDAAATLTLVKGGAAASTPTRPGPRTPASPGVRPTPARDPLLAALATVLEWAASPAGGASVAGAASAASAAAVGAWLDRGAASGGWGALVGAVCSPDNVPGAERLARAGAGECVAALLESARAARVGAVRDRARRAAAASARGEEDPQQQGAMGGVEGEDGAHQAGLGGAVADALARVGRAPDARALAISLVAASASAGVRSALGVAGGAVAGLPASLRAAVGGWVADAKGGGRVVHRTPRSAASRPASAAAAARQSPADTDLPPLHLLPALAVALVGALLAACVALAILRRAAVLGGLCGAAGAGAGAGAPWAARAVCP